MTKPKETAFQKRMREFNEVREQLATERENAKRETNSTSDSEA